jgi:hypothetical protein
VLQQDAAGITVTGVDGEGNQTVRTARFVVGCDGATADPSQMDSLITEAKHALLEPPLQRLEGHCSPQKSVMSFAGESGMIRAGSAQTLGKSSQSHYCMCVPQGPMPRIFVGVIRMTIPGGGLSMGGNLTSGPMYRCASCCSSSAAPPGVTDAVPSMTR